MTTIETLADEQIKALQSEAFSAGDWRLEQTCHELLCMLNRIAGNSPREYNEEVRQLKAIVVAAINAAEAQS